MSSARAGEHGGRKAAFWDGPLSRQLGSDVESHGQEDIRE